jgi:bacterioferritin
MKKGAKIPRAVEIVNLNVADLIKQLRTAFADEMNAAYQYWVGVKIARGLNRAATIEELMQHAQEELNHANMIAERLIQLDSSPIMYPEEWSKIGTCKYDSIKSNEVAKIITENITGERCAIKFYNDLLKKVYGKDFITYEMVTKILADEVEHEQDLITLQEDLG